MGSSSQGSSSTGSFPTFRQIQIIEAIAQRRSIGQAADALHLSQPAVTRALQQVEYALGVKLFERTPIGVVPTAFAGPILKRARSISDAMRETERELQRLTSPGTSRLRIGSGIHSTEIWTNHAVASMVLADHTLKITVDHYDWNDLIDHIRDGAIDYGLGEISEISTREDLAVEPLAELQLHFVCNPDHPLTRITQPSTEQIAQFPMIGNKLAQPIAAHFQNHIGRLGNYDPETGGIFSMIAVKALNAIKLALAESEAIALMPIDTVRQDVEAGTLVALDRSYMPWLIGRIGFISARTRRATPLMQAFRKAVIAIEAKRSGNGIETFRTLLPVEALKAPRPVQQGG